MSEAVKGDGPIEGVVGQVRWSYYVAAAINGYVVTRDPRTKQWQLAATVVMQDRFKLAQRPLEFVAPFRGGAMRWPIESFELTEGYLTARLGRMEV